MYTKVHVFHRMHHNIYKLHARHLYGTKRKENIITGIHKYLIYLFTKCTAKINSKVTIEKRLLNQHIQNLLSLYHITKYLLYSILISIYKVCKEPFP